MTRNRKRRIQGVVVSDKMEKTITILVESKKTHPLYNKQIKTSKKYKVHDEEGKAKMGDKVIIQENKPLSKTKRFILVDILEKK